MFSNEKCSTSNSPVMATGGSSTSPSKGHKMSVSSCSSSRNDAEEGQWTTLLNNLEIGTHPKPSKKQRNKEKLSSFPQENSSNGVESFSTEAAAGFFNFSRSKSNTATWLRDQMEDRSRKRNGGPEEDLVDSELLMPHGNMLNFPANHTSDVSDPRLSSQRSILEKENQKSAKDEARKNEKAVYERLSQLQDFISEATTLYQECEVTDESASENGAYARPMSSSSKTSNFKTNVSHRNSNEQTVLCSEEDALRLHTDLKNKCRYHLEELQQLVGEPLSDKLQETLLHHMQKKAMNNLSATQETEEPLEEGDLRQLHFSLECIKKSVQSMQNSKNGPEMGEIAAVEYERRRLKNKLLDLHEKKRLNDVLLQELNSLTGVPEVSKSEEASNSAVASFKQLKNKSLAEVDRKVMKIQTTLRHLEGMMKTINPEEDVSNDISRGKRDNMHRELGARRHYEAEGRANEDADLPPPPIQDKLRKLAEAKRQVKLLNGLMTSIRETHKTSRDVDSDDDSDEYLEGATGGQVQVQHNASKEDPKFLQLLRETEKDHLSDSESDEQEAQPLNLETPGSSEDPLHMYQSFFQQMQRRNENPGPPATNHRSDPEQRNLHDSKNMNSKLTIQNVVGGQSARRPKDNLQQAKGKQRNRDNRSNSYASSNWTGGRAQSSNAAVWGDEEENINEFCPAGNTFHSGTRVKKPCKMSSGEEQQQQFVHQLKRQIEQLNSLCHDHNLTAYAPSPDLMQPYNHQLLLCLNQCYHTIYMQQLEIQHLYRCLRQDAEGDPWWRPPFAPPKPFPVMQPVRAVIHPACQNTSAQETLNNQVPPRTRANNFLDNFRSYSRQNLLSSDSAKRNESIQIRHVQPMVAPSEINRSWQNPERTNTDQSHRTKRPNSNPAGANCLTAVKSAPANNRRCGSFLQNSSSANLLQMQSIPDEVKIGNVPCSTSATESLSSEEPGSDFFIGLYRAAKCLKGENQRQKVLDMIHNMALGDTVSTPRLPEANALTETLNGATGVDHEKLAARPQSENSLPWMNQAHLPTAAIPPLSKASPSKCAGASKRKSKQPIQYFPEPPQWDVSAQEVPSSDVIAGVVGNIMLDLQSVLPLGQMKEDSSESFWSSVNAYVISRVRAHSPLPHSALVSLRHALCGNVLSRFSGIKFCDCESEFLRFISQLLYDSLTAFMATGNVPPGGTQQQPEDKVPDFLEDKTRELSISMPPDDVFLSHFPTNMPLEVGPTEEDEWAVEADLAEADQSPGNEGHEEDGAMADPEGKLDDVPTKLSSHEEEVEEEGAQQPTSDEMQEEEQNPETHPK